MRLSFACLVIIPALLLPAGCATTPSSQHYFLTPLDEQDSATPGVDRPSGMTVVVVAVRVPPYLDRPQIVTRIAPNEVRLDEFHRWAGTFKDNITNVIVQNLSSLLGDARVGRHPLANPLGVDYRVFVDILQFDGIPGQNVTLLTNWSVVRKGDTAPPKLIHQKDELTAPLEAKDYSTLIAAQSRLLADLSRRIARALIAFNNHGEIKEANHGKADPQ